jgi:hypothetical protein
MKSGKVPRKAYIPDHGYVIAVRPPIDEVVGYWVVRLSVDEIDQDGKCRKGKITRINVSTCDMQVAYVDKLKKEVFETVNYNEINMIWLQYTLDKDIAAARIQGLLRKMYY